MGRDPFVLGLVLLEILDFLVALAFLDALDFLEILDKLNALDFSEVGRVGVKKEEDSQWKPLLI